MLYRLEEAIIGPIGRFLDNVGMALLARFTFLAVLAMFFWKSGLTKLGDGFAGIFFPSSGAYVQILPAQMEASGYDTSQLGFLSHAIVLLGTWGEFIIPALIIIGLFTRASSIAMIVFILVLSIVDITGHNADATTIGAWFDNIPDSKIIDQRLLWIMLLLILVTRGGGPFSVDALLKRRSAE